MNGGHGDSCTWESMGHYGTAEQGQLTWFRGGWEGGKVPSRNALKQKTVKDRVRPSGKHVHGTSQALEEAQ